MCSKTRKNRNCVWGWGNLRFQTFQTALHWGTSDTRNTVRNATEVFFFHETLHLQKPPPCPHHKAPYLDVFQKVTSITALRSGHAVRAADTVEAANQCGRGSASRPIKLRTGLRPVSEWVVEPRSLSMTFSATHHCPQSVTRLATMYPQWHSYGSLGPEVSVALLSSVCPCSTTSQPLPSCSEDMPSASPHGP